MTTLDQRTYIFNGLGEYRLLEVDQLVGEGQQARQVNFKLQARTCIANNDKGEPTSATVWCAVAMKFTTDDSVHVEVSNDGTCE